MKVERTIELDAAVEEVWAHLLDPGLRRDWVGEEADGAVVVDVVPGAALTWRWRDATGDGESEVRITLDPAGGGGRTALTVVEAPVPAAGTGARASAGGGGASRSLCRWDDRLLGLAVGLHLRHAPQPALV